MSIECRKAYIEFLGISRIKIVTPFKIKTFDFSKMKSPYIDLIALKEVNDPNGLIFFGWISDDRLFRVYAKIDESDIDNIGNITSDKSYSEANFLNATFKVNIFNNDD